MRSAALVALIALGGCNVVFGVDPGDGPGTVSGTYVQRWVENDDSGLPVNRSAPSTAQTALVTRDDGESFAIVLEEGSFEFPLGAPGQHYSIAIDGRDGLAVYDLEAPSPKLVGPSSSRPDRTPVPPGTSVALQFLIAPPTANKDELHSTGIWSRSQLTRSGSTFDLDWSAVQSTSGAPGLLEGVHNDGFYYAHYTSGPTYVTLDGSARVERATMVGGTRTTFPLTKVVPIVPDVCTHVIVATAAEQARVIALEAGATGFAVWAVGATPFLELSAAIGFPLAYTILADDVDVAASYGNPYLGHVVNAQFTAIISHGNALTVTASYVPASTSCETPTVVPTGVVAVPTHPSIAGVGLTDEDGQQISPDLSAPVPVTWDLSSTGHADLYVVKLQDVSSSIPIDRVVVTTTQTTTTLDPSRFTKGHTYRLEITARVGFPEAAVGDLETVTTEPSLARLNTASFVVPN